MRMLICAVLLAATPAFADSPAKIYKSKCASCHGADGQGAQKFAKILKLELADLALVDDASLKKSDAELIKLTAEGKGKMPGYGEKLTQGEIKGLVAYIRGLAGGAKKADKSAGGGADLKNGMALYNSKCAACHGQDGKGSAKMAGILKLDAAKMDLSSKDSKAKSLADWIAVTQKGEGKMPAYGEKFSADEIRDMVSYIYGKAGK